MLRHEIFRENVAMLSQAGSISACSFQQEGTLILFPLGKVSKKQFLYDNYFIQFVSEA